MKQNVSNNNLNKAVLWKQLGSDPSFRTISGIKQI